VRLHLPTASQTLLLRAALGTSPASDTAFNSWLRTVSDPLAGLVDPVSGDRRLLALLYDSLRSEESALPTTVRSRLRAATAHEELRADVLAQAGEEIVTELDMAGISPTLVGGGAVAYRAYTSPALRHCDSLDLLVAPGQLGAARAALASFSCNVDGGRLLVVHPSGSRVTVLDRLYLDPRRGCPADLGRRAFAVTIGRASVGTLSPADSLVEMCASASFTVAPGISWLADCALLIATDEVDWQQVTEHAACARAARVTNRALEWLAAHLDVTVPRPAQRALRRTGSREVTRRILGAARVGSTRLRPRPDSLQDTGDD